MSSVPASPHADRFVVLTGGPGAGKSTLIERLAALGYARSEEAGRGVIRDQVAVGGRGLPWADRELFAELMLSWELRSYRLAADPAAPPAGPVFFDRGLPDIVGYLRLEGLPVPAHVHAAAQTYRYHRRVCVAPFWPEIYAADAERKQSPEEAERTYRVMVETYAEYGYEPVELERAPVEERVRSVLRMVDGFATAE
ncbi:AAA family ATPase [Streptomyces purpurogeneiscleroticus]|uniref:AAA family ATPase n=1 Tax=Streptomyces purpurogeneiscleroticus TaxID=68259 RepID=UPI001CBC9EE6|nr:AAA family ATPase [Streptomyces purpurogeneiscleroticus]MBZ4020706.1 ATPase [Streptomyces purpurogeneiscleroticus]